MRIPQGTVKLPSADALRSARWFAGKHRAIARLRAADAIDVPGAAGSLVLLDVHDAGEAGRAPERYLLTQVSGREAEPRDGFWGALLAVSEPYHRLSNFCPFIIRPQYYTFR